MIIALKALGHDVQVIYSGPKPRKQWCDDSFHPSVHKDGLTFVTNGGRVDYLKTAQRLDLLRFFRDIQTYDDGGADVVITDYEPISARVARKQNIPSIGIGHLYAFHYEVPMAPGRLLGTWVMRHFAPADYPIGLHWHHFDQSILPPTIPPDVRSAHADIREDKILVYLPFENLGDIITLIESFRDYHFYVYHHLNTPSDEGHVHLRPFSRPGFVSDLASCAGVISNAGFSLPSEALHLGKKLLVKPVAHQVEQESNALAIEQLELGIIMKRLDPGILREWLDFTAIEPMNFPDVLTMLVDWIHCGRFDDLDSLVKRAWGRS
jgi:uncharacterized protein (TIGR00661 family)